MSNRKTKLVTKIKRQPTAASSNCEVFCHRKYLFHEETLSSADKTQLVLIRNCVRAAKRCVTFLKNRDKIQHPMKQIIFAIIFLSLSFYNCKSKRTDLVLPPKSISVNNLDGSEVFTIIGYDENDRIFKDGVATNLNQKEISDVERILEHSVENYNSFKKEYIDLNLYKRQYIAVKNKQGETEVWVNCFCKIAGEKWKTEIEYIDDGGNCYFNLKINLTKSSYYDFIVNGEA